MINKYFVLFSCCIPVQGAKRSIICDIQRDDYIGIPNILYHILTEFSTKTISLIKSYFDGKNDSAIDEYFDYLVQKNYGFYSDDYARFPKLELNEFYNYQQVTNAIIDYDSFSSHKIDNIIHQLSSLFCEALELRFFSQTKMVFLEEIFSALQGSTLRSVNLLIHYNNEFEEGDLKEFQHRNPRLKRVIVHSAPSNKVIETENVIIYYSTDPIHSESCCGIISPWYFSTNTMAFSEAKKHNSCLNKKISVDKYGNIKNCPSFENSYGHITETSLNEVISLKDFKAVWDINKDKIEVCKDCEYRYICQDCRAYISDPNNIHSKPLKCNYDPYED
jgi:SPASM domain peptide maturase of grasp-with-spasm system